MQRKPGFLKAIFLTGLLAGTLDITAACIHFYLSGGKALDKLFRFIASGIFGPEAFTGSMGFAWYGLLLHYLIAFIFTLLFFILYPSIHKLIKSTVVTGILYGMAVWFIMNLIVLPLSKAPAAPYQLSKAAIAMGILIAMIGVPVSLLAHRYYERIRASKV